MEYKENTKQNCSKYKAADVLDLKTNRLYLFRLVFFSIILFKFVLGII